MRRHRAAAAGMAAAVIFLAGCGGGRSGITRGDLPYQPGRHLPFAERAALVLGNWAYSGAQRLWGRGLEHRWFTGLVLLDCTLRQAGPGRPAGWAW